MIYNLFNTQTRRRVSVYAESEDGARRAAFNIYANHGWLTALIF